MKDLRLWHRQFLTKSKIILLDKLSLKFTAFHFQLKADSYACYWTNCQSHYCSDSLLSQFFNILSSSHHLMFLVYLLFTNDYIEGKDRIDLFNMHKKEKKTNQKYNETGCNCWEVCLQIMWSCYLRSFHVKISIKIIKDNLERLLFLVINGQNCLKSYR